MKYMILGTSSRMDMDGLEVLIAYSQNGSPNYVIFRFESEFLIHYSGSIDDLAYEKAFSYGGNEFRDALQYFLSWAPEPWSEKEVSVETDYDSLVYDGFLSKTYVTNRKIVFRTKDGHRIYEDAWHHNPALEYNFVYKEFAEYEPMKSYVENNWNSDIEYKYVAPDMIKNNHVHYDMKHNNAPTLAAGTGKLSYGSAGSMPPEVKLLPGLDERVSHPSGCLDTVLICNEEDSVKAMVIHLNDRHGWSREKIADWLESLDVDLRFKTTTKEETHEKD